MVISEPHPAISTPVGIVVVLDCRTHMCLRPIGVDGVAVLSTIVLTVVGCYCTEDDCARWMEKTYVVI
jgi:hypothetical protein